MTKSKIFYFFIFLFLIQASFTNAQKKQPSFEERFKEIDSLFESYDLKNYKKLLWSTRHLARHKKDTLNLLKSNRILFKYYLINKYNEDSLLHYYNKGKDILKQYPDKEYTAYYDYMYTEYLVDKGNYVKAYAILNALENHIKQNNYHFSPYFYAAFAKLHYRLNELDLAFEKLKIASKIFKTRNTPKSTSATYNNLGILYKKQKQYDSSLVYHSKSLKISLQLNDTIGIAYSYNNIGLVHYLINNIQQAEQYYLNALKIKPKNPSKALLTNYSKILISRGNYSRAEDLLIKVERETKNPKVKIDALIDLIALSKLQNKYKKALKLSDRLLVEKETLMNLKKIEEIERLKALHDTENKEKKIQLLTEQKTKQELVIKQNKILSFVILLIIFLLFIIGGLILRNKIINKQANNLILEQQLFRSQMNPHFIFNALSNIQTTILKKETEKAVDYLSKFSKLVRNILESSKKIEITFANELEAIMNYLDLQKIRFENNLVYTINLDEDIEEDLTLIPAMLFQPLIENAIEHGIETVEHGTLEISFVLKDQCITCTVIDNGIGYSNTTANSNLQKQSMSTDIIKSRLAFYSKKIKYPFVFSVKDYISDSKIIGTITIIDLPIL